MSEQATTSAVRQQVTVPIDPERAFKLFTEGSHPPSSS